MPQFEYEVQLDSFQCSERRQCDFATVAIATLPKLLCQIKTMPSAQDSVNNRIKQIDLSVCVGQSMEHMWPVAATKMPSHVVAISRESIIIMIE
jgi:hypothetical protein